MIRFSSFKGEEMETCSFCSGTLKWKKQYFKYPDVNWLIIDETDFATCEKCGEGYQSIQSPNRLEEWMAHHIVMNRGIGPKEVYFLRVFLNAQSRFELATWLGTLRSVIHSWEQGLMPAVRVQDRLRNLVRKKHPELFPEGEKILVGTEAARTGTVHVVHQASDNTYQYAPQPS
mgnify:CR=1 FL=1